MTRRVRVPSGKGGFRWAKWGPVWGGVGEVPLFTIEYADADLAVYGSGTAELIMLEMPIITRMPVAVVGDEVHLALPAGSWRGLLMALKKVTTGPGAAPGGGPGATDKAMFPNLWAHLTETAYPEGGPRETSSIIIVADSTGWRGCLSDKDNGRTMWKTSASVEELLLQLEEGAGSEDPSQWRQSAAGKWRGKKKA